MITPEIAAERAARGAAWLDDVLSDWAQRITLEHLAMDDSCHCVAGQAFAEGYMALIPQLTHYERLRHGFFLENFDTLGVGYHEAYGLLQAAWEREITKRLDAP